MIKILIADDHKMMRDGLKALLADISNIEIVGEAANGLEILELVNKYPVDLCILDIDMPGLSGLEVCKKINKNYSGIKVLALTMYDEPSIISGMIKNGASGYILKNAGQERLIQAIHAVMEGKQYFPEEIKDKYFSKLLGKDDSRKLTHPKLTRREKEIITLILKEYTTFEIAEKLCISEKTVETHRMHLLQKFNVRNTAGLVRAAVEMGLHHADED